MNASRKRWLPLALILSLGILAVVHVQRSHLHTQPSPQAMLAAAADAQHELTRLPARLAPLPDADEVRIGNTLADHTAHALHADALNPHDANVEAYLQTVLLRTTTHTRRHLPWRVHYIPDPTFINAFALPGGHIFLGQGLLQLITSEDALAAVLGHEAEHIDLGHCAERLQLEAHERRLGDLTGPFDVLLTLPLDLFVTGYSKAQELEADRDGTTLAVLAGYSPQGILQLFATFATLEAHPTSSPNSNTPTAPDPVSEAANLSLSTLSGYFASHPPAAERSQQITTLSTTQHWPSPPLTPLPTLLNS